MAACIQVRIPDVCIPDMLPAPGLLSMVAGDFAEVYSRPDAAGTFDAVVTCFFLDTAHNVIEYMEVIRHVLKVREPHIPCCIFGQGSCTLAGNAHDLDFVVNMCT